MALSLPDRGRQLGLVSTDKAPREGLVRKRGIVDEVYSSSLTRA